MNPSDLLPHGTLQHGVALAILAMAITIAVTRVAGFWLMGQFTITPRLNRMLEALPGAVVAAIIVPAILRDGTPAILAAGAVVAVMLLLRKDYLAIATGLLVVALARAGGL